jgi:PAS domain S-box-containing protein
VIDADWFDAALETAPTAMGVVSTLEGRYVRANQALADLFGMRRDEIIGSDPYILGQRMAHPDDLVAEQKLFAELAVGARTSYRIEKRLCRPDGDTRWVDTTLTGIYGAEVDPTTQVRPLQFVIVNMVDVTTQKALAETLKRLETELRHAQKIDGIGRLAAGIAHDFNNLLTVIMGHANVLRELAEEGAPPPPPAELREGLDAILAASGRAASLTAAVLAHGRRERVTRQTFALSDAVEKLQRLLDRTIGSDVEVRRTLTAQGSIFADEGQIGQVVMNLVLNARDAVSPGGSIALSTRDLVVPAGGRGTPPPGTWVTLSVSDDGHGMTDEVKARIFEPFFTTRTDRAGTRGTGLGLPTVQRIVSEAGGHFNVESAPGRGTTVTVYLPRAEGAQVKAAGTPREPRRADPAPNTRRVLVVEDESSVRALVANVLLGAHYHVVIARDGEEALRLIEDEREPFDLVVTDVVMPTVGGVTLAERLRGQNHGTRILFISGYSQHAGADLLGLGRLLPKPFTPAQLLDAVRDVLDT